jgi:hypothetical protein
MADKSDNTIDQYYSTVDKNLILNLCKNNNLKNLIKLSTVSDLYIFNKKNKKWYLKSKEKLLKECENIKKKELKTSSIMLSNLAKLNTIQDISNVKDICENLQTKISNLDNLIKCINHIESPIDNIIQISYDNYKNMNKKYNVVSFDEIIDIKIVNREANEILKPTIISTVSKDEIKIINLNHDLDKHSQSVSDSSDSFIECYSNC